MGCAYLALAGVTCAFTMRAMQQLQVCSCTRRTRLIDLKLQICLLSRSLPAMHNLRTGSPTLCPAWWREILSIRCLTLSSTILVNNLHLSLLCQTLDCACMSSMHAPIRSIACRKQFVPPDIVPIST